MKVIGADEKKNYTFTNIRMADNEKRGECLHLFVLFCLCSLNVKYDNLKIESSKILYQTVTRYADRLKLLNLRNLQTRRIINDLIMCFKFPKKLLP